MSYSIINGIALALFYYFAAAPEAAAYIDPSTGSYFIQILIGGLVTVGFALKTGWGHLKAIFCKGKACEAAQPDESTAQSQTGAAKEQSPSAG